MEVGEIDAPLCQVSVEQSHTNERCKTQKDWMGCTSISSYKLPVFHPLAIYKAYFLFLIAPPSCYEPDPWDLIRTEIIH